MIRFYKNHLLFSVDENIDVDNKEEHQNAQIEQESKKVLPAFEEKMKQKEISQEYGDYDFNDLPEPHRRTDNNPLVLTVEKGANDDIYFIGRIELYCIVIYNKN